MALIRTIVSLLALVALMASTCAPALAVPLAAMHVPPVREALAVPVIAAEPCPASHGATRCEPAALPATAVVPVGGLALARIVAPPPETLGHGTWPEVEPHPPRT